MARIISSFLIGLLFGAGLIVSAMINPAKVIGFLDIAGAWDLDLAVVMASALFTAMVGYRLVFQRQRPLFDAQFHLPAKKEVDTRLVTGAGLFGIGWGLSGYCPGPAIAGLTLGASATYYFLIAMVAGMALYRATLGGGFTAATGGPALDRPA